MRQSLLFFLSLHLYNPSLHFFSHTSPNISAGAGLDPWGANVTLSTEYRKCPPSALRWIKYLNHDINDTLLTVSLCNSVIPRQRVTS